MTDQAPPRFALWFRRWWIALVGAVVAAGGGVLWLAALLALPRGTMTYGWFAYQPLAGQAFAPAASPLRTLGAVLFIVGLVAVAATVGFRAGRARRR